MSGIAGIVHFDGAPADSDALDKMTATMVRRGPDGVGRWIGDTVALGQCMFRTTPESLLETQPLANEDETLVLVMDGRVDNCGELRRELLERGARLRDRTDAELVLRAYEAWGEECPLRIVGEFVFFIWDACRRRLFAARDAAGVRHFYYHRGAGWFAFASEIKGLLALGRIEPQLNESRLMDYLEDEFDRDDEVGTFFLGVERLPAGHAMRVAKRGVETWRYWDPGALPAARFASIDDCAAAYLTQLRVAVKCRLRSIAPVGATLSGGLDSSTIVGLISKEFRDELPQPLRTFSLVRRDRENCQDWPSIARILADDDWLEPNVVTSDLPLDFCRSFHADAAKVDEPFALTHGLIQRVLVEAARSRGCNVLLEGMAGDLHFYAYDRTLESILRSKRYGRLPLSLLACLLHEEPGGVATLFRRSAASVAPGVVKDAFRRLRDSRLRREDELGSSYTEAARIILRRKSAKREEARARVREVDDRALHARNFTSGLLSFAQEVCGQIALSNGVELRSPYADRRLIEFAVSMPAEAKWMAPWYKHLLRKSARGLLPESVRWRRSLAGHPGWTFFETMLNHAQDMPSGLWNADDALSAIRNWVDDRRPARPAVLTSEEQRFASYQQQLLLFQRVALGYWLKGHGFPELE